MDWLGDKDIVVENQEWWEVEYHKWVCAKLLEEMLEKNIAVGI